MALNQSALDEIAAMLKGGDSFDLVRSAAELVLQAHVEAEAAAHNAAESEQDSGYNPRGSGS